MRGRAALQVVHRATTQSFPGQAEQFTGRLKHFLVSIHAGALEDTMESFFLSETTKYLYLLHSNATALPDYYIFSTEGHLLPVLAFPADTADLLETSQTGASGEPGLCKASEQEKLDEAGGVEGDAQGGKGVADEEGDGSAAAWEIEGDCCIFTYLV